MTDVQLTIYPNELDRLLRSPGGPVGRYLVRLARETVEEAQTRASAGPLKRRTGRYAEGFKIETDFSGPNGFTVRVRNATTGLTPMRRQSYASVIETGSRAHQIRPRRNDGWLYFRYRGRLVRTRKVNHPGTRPYWILRDSLRTVVLRHGGR